MIKIPDRNGYEVLNKGMVALVEHMGNDLSIVRNARVSYDAEWRAGEDEGKDEKLLNYLVKNDHTSPLEGVTFTFEVKAPIFVLRQWHRHRTWSYNEISARYSELSNDMFVPSLEQITTQSDTNKQMRTDTQNEDDKQIQSILNYSNNTAYFNYQKMIELGCPRELARTVLPVGIYSHMFATVNLNNLSKFFALRLHNHAQYEIRVYAEAMLKIIEPILPITTKALRKKYNY